jgi:hypothetical protein
MHDHFCMLLVIFFKPDEIVCSSSAVKRAGPDHIQAAAIAMSSIAIACIALLAAKLVSLKAAGA